MSSSLITILSSSALYALAEMGVSLTELAVKGTASAVNKKIRAVKDVKDAEKLRVRLLFLFLFLIFPLLQLIELL